MEDTHGKCIVAGTLVETKTVVMICVVVFNHSIVVYV